MAGGPPCALVVLVATGTPSLGGTVDVAAILLVVLMLAPAPPLLLSLASVAAGGGSEVGGTANVIGKLDRAVVPTNCGTALTPEVEVDVLVVSTTGVEVDVGCTGVDVDGNTLAAAVSPSTAGRASCEAV